jgi:hypothetical protein
VECRLEDRLLDISRELDGDEPTCGIQVVLTLLIYNANHLMLGRVVVLENFVNLSKLERCFLLRVVNADGEMLLAAHIFLTRRLIFMRRLPIPCPSNQ